MLVLGGGGCLVASHNILKVTERLFMAARERDRERERKGEREREAEEVFEYIVAKLSQ